MSIESTNYVFADDLKNNPAEITPPAISDVPANSTSPDTKKQKYNRLISSNRSRVIGGSALLILSLCGAAFGIKTYQKHEDELKNEVVTATLLERGFRAHGISVSTTHGGHRIHIGCEDITKTDASVALDFDNSMETQEASLPGATQTDAEGLQILSPSIQTIELSSQQKVNNFIGSEERTRWCQTIAKSHTS